MVDVAISTIKIKFARSHFSHTLVLRGVLCVFANNDDKCYIGLDMTDEQFENTTLYAGTDVHMRIVAKDMMSLMCHIPTGRNPDAFDDELNVSPNYEMVPSERYELKCRISNVVAAQLQQSGALDEARRTLAIEFGAAFLDYRL